MDYVADASVPEPRASQSLRGHDKSVAERAMRGIVDDRIALGREAADDQQMTATRPLRQFGIRRARKRALGVFDRCDHRLPGCDVGLDLLPVTEALQPRIEPQ